MALFVNDPTHWRARAAEARALAETLTDSIAYDQMMEVAAAYERMAERAEKQPIKTPLKSESRDVEGAGR